MRMYTKVVPSSNFKKIVKKTYSFEKTRNFSISAVYGKEQKSHAPFHCKEAIGDSLPNCSMSEIPPSSFEPTMDQWLLSLERMLKRSIGIPLTAIGLVLGG